MQYDFKATANIKNSKVSAVKGTAYNLRKIYSNNYKISINTHLTKYKVTFNISHNIKYRKINVKKIR